MASTKKKPEMKGKKLKSNSSEGTSFPADSAVLNSLGRKSPTKGGVQKQTQPCTASFSVAFSALLFVRTSAALFSNVQDCDEVFNYWEPTHYLQYGHGIQTWEYSPEYAIRSWAYILPHAHLGKILSLIMHDKIKVFYGIRIVFAAFSAFCEARFYRAVLDQFGNRVGRYLFIMLLSSTGMWNASIEFLPSTFSMYTTMLGFTFALGPVASKNAKRVYFSILLFGLGALLAWPFSAAIGFTMIFEELFIRGTESIKSKNINWRWLRIKRVSAAISYTMLISIPIILIDYFFYKKITFVPLNIIFYNIFGGEARGPNLYGTEPWTYYFINGFLNFNILFLMALLSIPALITTFFIDNGRIATQSPTVKNYPYIVVLLRLVPFYLWLSIFIAQPHKEERFLYVVYPMICLNAAVTLFLARGWFDRWLFEFGFIRMARRERRKAILSLLTSFILVTSVCLSASRIASLYLNYHAPMSIYEHLYYVEVPSHNSTFDRTINVCVGKEWYRFPGDYFLPQGVRLRFLRSEFKGLLPKYFLEGYEFVAEDGQITTSYAPIGTWQIPTGFNDLNQENPDNYDTNTDKCDYLVDLDLKQTETTLEPRYRTLTDQWLEVKCLPFLDANNSHRYARAFYMPDWFWAMFTKYAPSFINPGPETLLHYGDYCLLKKIEKATIKEPKANEYIKPTNGFFGFW